MDGALNASGNGEEKVVVFIPFGCAKDSFGKQGLAHRAPTCTTFRISHSEAMIP